MSNEAYEARLRAVTRPDPSVMSAIVAFANAMHNVGATVRDVTVSERDWLRLDLELRALAFDGGSPKPTWDITINCAGGPVRVFSE